MMQQPPKTMEMLHPVDVGAASGRPRATNRRPYEVFRYVFEFCNRPFLRPGRLLGVFGLIVDDVRDGANGWGIRENPLPGKG